MSVARAITSCFHTTEVFRIRLDQEQLPEEYATPKPGASWAELVASGDRHLVVNDIVATIMGQYLHRLPIHSFVTYTGIGDFISSRSLPVCREELEVFLGGD